MRGGGRREAGSGSSLVAHPSAAVHYTGFSAVAGLVMVEHKANKVQPPSLPPAVRWRFRGVESASGTPGQGVTEPARESSVV